MNSSRVAANLGFGFRQLSDDESYFIGTNLFFDLDDEANKRASLGLEFHSSIVGANMYRSLGSSSNLVDGNTERVLDGYDINIVGQMPFMPWAEIVYTDYRWEAEIASQDSDGYKFAGEFWLTDYVRLEIGVDDSKVRDRNEFAGLSFSYPSRERPSLNDGFFTSKAFPEVSVRADLNMKVRRNNRLVIETEGSGSNHEVGLMPKFVNFLYLFSLTVGTLGLASAGDNTGPANQYVVTLTKMELCTMPPLLQRKMLLALERLPLVTKLWNSI